jgi:hypothetical protein
MASMDVGSWGMEWIPLAGIALNTSAKVSVDAETSWKNAQDAVLKDLSEHPEWLGAIEILAAELAPELGL